MWWKIILIILVLLWINMYWDEKYDKSRKQYKDRRKRRLYKFLMGLSYLITAGLSLLLIEFIGDIILVYAVLGIIFGIGSLLSAINSNLREIYAVALIYGFIIWLISSYFGEHKIIIFIVDIFLIGCILAVVKESIENIRYGIDPDFIEEEKKRMKKWKLGFKLVKSVIGIWRH